MNRTILHIDFDSFFASVEQQHSALLRGRPIGVTATNGRTCIIASSREAKVLGIKTGARTYHAKRICPSIFFVVADFVKYFEVSKKFLNICKDYSPFVELFSIDEVFIDITQTEHLFRYRHSGEPAERSTPESLRTHYGVRRFWTLQFGGQASQNDDSFHPWGAASFPPLGWKLSYARQISVWVSNLEDKDKIPPNHSTQRLYDR